MPQKDCSNTAEQAGLIKWEVKELIQALPWQPKGALYFMYLPMSDSKTVNHSPDTVEDTWCGATDFTGVRAELRAQFRHFRQHGSSAGY